ncbi:type II secretion system protein, partial [Lactobacillus bombi]|nr:type II secretion system protein [Bombilactobacillus bombi]
MLWVHANKSQKAFTLIEAVISLGIICGVLLIPSINYQQQLVVQQEKLALLEFQNNWHNLVNDSFLYNE